MATELFYRSPAKLNLMLHITGQQADGYHLLQTVFQFIDLCDHLGFRLRHDRQIRRIDSDTPVNPENDLVLKAAQLLQRETRVALGVDISVNKQIPIGGGLGGGSSDAATTLMALKQLWQIPIDAQQLARLGRQLGADVPIFIYGKNAWAEGIGDQFEAVELPETWYLVVHPGVFVSTGEIFSAKDLTRDCHPIKIRAFLEGAGQNVCEPVACRLYPEIRRALDWLNQFSPARMTGTGACIFAGFHSDKEANDVKSRLPESWQGYVVKALPGNPVADSCFQH